MWCGVWSHNVPYATVMSAAALRGGLERVWRFYEDFMKILFSNNTDFLAILTVFLQCYPPMLGILKKQDFCCCLHRVVTVHRPPKMLV